MNYYPYGYNWYDNYISNSWNRWYSPWGFNYPRYGNGYGNRYGYGYGYGYGMWNNWWHPYYNGPDYNDPYYYRNDNRVAYMNGKRSSLYSTDKGILDNSSSSNSTTNYNVGRNDSKIVKSKTGGKDEKSEELKNRNINRVYYALKNGQGRVGPARGYQNRGEIVNYGNSGTDSKSRSKSNFQASKYGSNTRSYDVSRSSKGSLNRNKGYSRSEINNTNSSNSSRGYSRPENNGNSSSGQARSYSRPSSNSNSSSSSNSRSNYTQSSSSSRSSVGNVSSGSSGRSGSVSRSKR
jgi:hypothetical protein